MSKLGVKIPPTTDEKIPTTDNNNSAGGLNGLVNGDNNKKVGRNKKSENHRKDVSSKSEIVAGTKPKKRNRKQRNNEDVEEAEELTKLDLYSIINRNREPVASSSRGVNTETLINDLKDLNIDAELSDIACATETNETQEVKEEEKEVKELPSVDYVQYESELQMPMIMKLIQKDLSEPYSIYTYRYFIHNWPKLCFLVCYQFCFIKCALSLSFLQAMCEGNCVGAIVCKLDLHRKVIRRGYIAMLAVDENYRKRGIGSTLVRRAIQEMIAGNADEVVLETEITNKPALQLYEALGFVRDKRLFRYYLNGVDALRLKLWLR